MRDEPLIRWSWIPDNLDAIAQRLNEHILLTLIAVGAGFAISFALSILITRRRGLYGPITALAGILYTIPSLAFFALLVPFTGVSILTVELALISYTVLILVRNTVAGLDGVPADVKEAAEGMGYTRWRRLWTVELPLALPVIIAGLRIATVTTIGLVTVGAILGQGGLGRFILVGVRQFFPTAIIVGAVLSVVLAVLADLLFLALLRVATPWARSRGT